MLPVNSHSEVDRWLAECRGRLRRTVELRLDRRIVARVDPSDVVQEAALEAAARYGEYCANPTLPPHLWLRLITLQRLALVHRQHLGVQARDVRREWTCFESKVGSCSASMAALADMFVASQTSPSQAAHNHELRRRVHDSLAQLEDLDREVLALRHFEQLNNSETATVLEISSAAASKRYLRALARMKKVLQMVESEERL